MSLNQPLELMVQHEQVPTNRGVAKRIQEK
jgi:hypothetical protein